VSTPTGRSTGFARTRPAPRPRDPLGKAALFSEPEPAADDVPPEEAGRGVAHLFSRPEPRPGTVVVDCSGCGLQTRVTYAEFAALHFPLWLWAPLPGRSHRHWLRCPTCHHFAWMRAHWLE
jgi:hypothetical protein